MFVIYDEIRLDPSDRSIAVNEMEWTISPQVHSLHHGPTRTIFQIGVDEKETESAPLTPGDFAAHLVALGEGCALPSPEEIEALGRAAIALYLVAFG